MSTSPRIRMRPAAILTASCTFGVGVAVGSAITLQLVLAAVPSAHATAAPITDPLGHLATTSEPLTTASPEPVLTEPVTVVTEPVIVPEIVAEPVTEPVTEPTVEEVIAELPEDTVEWVTEGPAMELVPGRLPACYLEDSEDCIWLADLEGNGIGTDFIRYDGVTYYPEGSGF